ncbi:MULTISPECIES: hypothetical protein [unclassified Streptomyces]|uniref:hypothetical protein n=1 Tax=unclassified Streptomyces TaxID=2593676 RepID=UPI00225C3CCB|nr:MULTISPECIES: hypothetical protein [unclassified Streptomyces]MCX4528584.1 EcsC family protein [Streptomyces sp. NBC_01551]MCX4540809.1 EcsC family protein [Streptomyces sp. NBC_01565]
MTGSTPFRKMRFRKTGDPAETQAGATGPATGPGAPGVPAVPSGTTAAVPSATAAGEGSRITTGTRRMQAVRNGVRKGGVGVRAAALYVADRIIEIAPRVPVRDLATLRAQFPGLGPDQLADKLIVGAANATSTVGAGIGAAAMLPVPPAMPAELAAEITAVAAIELKLIAELHEVYGRRPSGDLKARSLAYLTAWTEERGVDLTKPTTLNAALGGQMKRELRQQIMKRMFRNLPNLMPFMVGAAVGAVMNRRDTRKLAEKVRTDLRARAVAWDALHRLPPLEQPVQPLPGALRAALEGPGPGARG